MGTIIGASETPDTISLQSPTSKKLKKIKEEQGANRLDVELRNMTRMRYGFLSNTYHIEYPSFSKGSFGEVFHVTHQLTMIKRVGKRTSFKLAENRDIFTAEFNLVKWLDHPNIIRFYEAVSQDSYGWIVQETCDGNLTDYMATKPYWSQDEVKVIFRQILYAVSYLHANNILHGDLKPSNILYIKGVKQVFKIIDFGSAIVVSEKQQNLSVEGASGYRAPEALSKASLKCDVWSLGVILFKMLVNVMPFTPQDVSCTGNLQSKMKNGFQSLFLKQMADLSDNAKNLLDSLLRFNPKERIDVVSAINHPWFTIKNKINKAQLMLAEIEAEKSFKEFNSLSGFLVLITAYIANFMAPNKELNKLEVIFSLIDADRDGMLNEQELFNYISQSQKYPVAGWKESCAMMFKKLGKQPDFKMREVTLRQFITIFSHPRKLLKQRVVSILFSLIDSKKAGRITVQDMCTFFGSNNKQLFVRELEQIKMLEHGLGRQDFAKLLLY